MCLYLDVGFKKVLITPDEQYFVVLDDQVDIFCILCVCNFVTLKSKILKQKNTLLFCSQIFWFVVESLIFDR